MDQKAMFGSAVWVGAGFYSGRDTGTPDKNGVPYFPVLRRSFYIDSFSKVSVRALGLGYFHLYINGTELTENAFLPLSTDYEERENYPENEKLTGHRIYVPEFDITPYVHTGKNVLALHFGGGWYSHDCDDAFYGMAKAIYRICINDGDKTLELVSSENDLISDSFIKTAWFTEFENHDYTDWDDSIFSESFDDSGLSHAVKVQQVNTQYLFSDCPADKIFDKLSLKLTKEDSSYKCYDTGLNCSAIPVFSIYGKKGEEVSVIFSEEKNEDGSPDMNFFFGQKINFICDGKKRTVRPAFTWFSFRYMKITGPGDIVRADFLHADVKEKAEFHCDNETLNSLFTMYKTTQLSNMHGGIPSDCPHLERRGYTGDGQLTCHAAMTVFDCREFYKKWIYDISDCQDIYSGHVQYTAPYNRAGGGPGGWGCAIVEVPYQYYKHYGDDSFLHKLYPQMLDYFRYLDAHSVNNLLVSDKEGDWCLGDWCALNEVKIPDAFVNNYFYIKSLIRFKEIAEITGNESHIPYIENKIEILKTATHNAYFNKFYLSYCGGCQGADAFALDIGLGNEDTYKHLKNRYTENMYYDTGIFGTDILTRVLFNSGDTELAVKLMTNESPYNFYAMMKKGATTLWENWAEDKAVRSHNHPMFGAVCAYIFDYIAGIRQTEKSAGFSDIIIAPAETSLINDLEASLIIPQGKVSISYKKYNDRTDFKISLPCRAEFIYKNIKKELNKGKSIISI